MTPSLIVPVVTMTFDVHDTSQYSDIRDEVRKRIDLLEKMVAEEQSSFAAKQEKLLAAHKAAMDGYKRTLANYRDMLILEESFAKNILKAQDAIGPQMEGGAKVQITIPQARLSLADYLIGEIEKRGPLGKEQLRLSALMAGYFEHGDTGGRAVHATLMNFLRNKRLTVGINGEYAIPANREACMS